MDFWGIDKSQTSLRLKALERLGRLDAAKPSGDLQRLSGVLSSSANQTAGKLPMYPKEFEVLLALAEAASTVKDKSLAEVLAKQLGDYFVESLDQQIVASPTIKALAPSPWYLETYTLTRGLLGIGAPVVVFRNFIERASTLWTKATDDKLITWAFSIYGFIDGLASSDALTIEVGQVAYEWIKSFLNDEFQAQLHSRLGVVEHSLSTSTSPSELSLPQLSFHKVQGEPIAYPGAAQLTLAVSQFVRSLARVAIGAHGNGIDFLLSTLQDTDASEQNGLSGGVSDQAPVVPVAKHESFLKELASYSSAAVEILEGSQQFRATVTPHLIPISVRSIWSHFEVLGVAVFYNLFSAKKAFDYFIAAAEVDQLNSKDDSLFNLVRLAVVCCREDEARIAVLIKALPDYLGAVSPSSAEKVGSIFVKGLSGKPQSWLVSALYALANTLSIDEYLLRKNQYEQAVDPDKSGIESIQEIDQSVGTFAASILAAIVSMVLTYKDSQVNALALTVLSQKYGAVNQIVDREILTSYATLAPHLPERDFEGLLQQIVRAEHDAREKGKEQIIEAVELSRHQIAKSVPRDTDLYSIYLDHLLTLVIGTGDFRVSSKQHGRSHTDVSNAAKEVLTLLAPLAAMFPNASQRPLEIADWSLTAKFRDAWFNLTVLGYNTSTKWTAEQNKQLEIIARSTPPLVSEASANQTESDLELNPVLLRGTSHSHLGNQRKMITGVFRSSSEGVSHISYVKLMFLSATVLVESFRARAGIISKTALYFGDPDFRTGSGYRELSNVTNECMNEYINSIKARSVEDERFDLDAVSTQLKELLVLSCHRVDAIRDIALHLADTLISLIPSSLVHRNSIFALLDLLTLMWESCVDAEQDEYEPKTTFSAARSGVKIELSDSYETRRYTLRKLLGSARKWSGQILPLMNEEVKSLLTFYLDDLENSSSQSFDSVAIGRSFALEMGGTIRDVDGILGEASNRGQGNPGRLADGASGFLSQYLSLSEYRSHSHDSVGQTDISRIIAEYDRLCAVPNPTPDGLSTKDLRQLYAHSASLINSTNPLAIHIVQYAIHVPFRFFSGGLIKTGISYWLWILNQNSDLRLTVLHSVAEYWCRSIYRKIGLFNRDCDIQDAMFAPMEYGPTNKELLDFDARKVESHYEPHVALIHFLKSTFHATALVSGPYLDLYARMLKDSMYGLIHYASMHPIARTARLELIKLALEVLTQYGRHRPQEARGLRKLIINAALSWYKQLPVWSYGGNLITQRKDAALLTDIISGIKNLHVNSSTADLLLFFLQEELNRLQVWYDSLGNTKAGSTKFVVSSEQVTSAWKIDPELAVYLLSHHADATAKNTLIKLVEYDPLQVIHVPSALQYFLDSPKSSRRRYVLYWSQVSPIESITLFSPGYGGDSYLLQYAMRSLETHPIETAFFYVPQIVQSLRHDQGGYVEEYILEAAKFSQLFSHQIIWNILANSYKDDDEQIPDPMKPALDRVLARMSEHFSDEEKKFYETEFGFFGEITSISGKLRPYIKKTKAEKKAKIDEEMAKIALPTGAYLPSNPDGIVVDIGRESGRPLQSHAKAPFLAKFLIERDVKHIDENDQAQTTTVHVWQGAIFKVGDDCRQDLLSLQLISVFRSIFNSCGLDVWVFPYKVTATGAGQGVIDVLPNSTSRDMVGREAVNGLYEWYISKHGAEDSIKFQRARKNLVKSMAAYSVISYLLQFKDRHNGNIMYDDDGHVIHIDFGFIFDLVPGGVKFEAVPFKLTKEMVAVMGGSSRTQPYKWFEELCVKSFLACRVYAEDVIRMVGPMIESGLPCFKGDTIKKLRSRFVLNKTEREAAQYMRGLIARSYESNFTRGYDEFQRLTNGIPY